MSNGTEVASVIVNTTDTAPGTSRTDLTVTTAAHAFPLVVGADPTRRGLLSFLRTDVTLGTNPRN